MQQHPVRQDAQGLPLLRRGLVALGLGARLARSLGDVHQIRARARATGGRGHRAVLGESRVVTAGGLLDTLGVLLSVPISIYLGMLFAGQVEVLEGRLGGLSLLLAFLLLSVLIILGARSRSRRRARLEILKEERQQRLAPSASPESPPGAE